MSDGLNNVGLTFDGLNNVLTNVNCGNAEGVRSRLLRLPGSGHRRQAEARTWGESSPAYTSTASFLMQKLLCDSVHENRFSCNCMCVHNNGAFGCWRHHQRRCCAVLGKLVPGVHLSRRQLPDFTCFTFVAVHACFDVSVHALTCLHTHTPTLH